MKFPIISLNPHSFHLLCDSIQSFLREYTVWTLSHSKMSHKTIHVPHLGSIGAAYQMPHEYNPQKLTIVLVHSFMTNSDLYQSQFADKELTAAVNLVAIDLPGHGKTRAISKAYTYWDMAMITIHVMSALKIKHVLRARHKPRRLDRSPHSPPRSRRHTLPTLLLTPVPLTNSAH
jgi:hypothetical protein